MESKKNAFDFSSTNLLIFLWHWRKTLLIVMASALVLSILFSSPWFITPKYKSKVIMYPVSTSSLSKVLISKTYYGNNDVMEFGAEEQAEQLIQLLNSSEIKQRVIDKFNLTKHYNNGSNDIEISEIFKEFESNITFKRNEYMAVEITVLDKDPEIAANIANNISELVDTIKNKIQKERAVGGFKIVEKEYHNLQEEIAETGDSLDKIRALGINDYKSQSERFNQQYAIALANGNTKGAKRIKQQIDTLAKYGGAYVSLNEIYEGKLKQMPDLRQKYNEAKIDAEQYLPQKFIVERAFKASKKAYPIRWLILLVTTFSALVLAILSIIVIQTIRSEAPKSAKTKNTELLV